MTVAASGWPRDQQAPSERMNITYLLEDTEQSGGVRVQLVHADALIGR